MTTISLDGTWQLTYGPQLGQPANSLADPLAADWKTIPATVPGNVEIDLMRAGELPELSRGNNIHLLRPLEGYQWWYRRTFASPTIESGQRVDLVFDGLDCLGTVWINGEEVGRPRNMLIAHRLDVTDALHKVGENEIVVRIESAVIEGRRHEMEALAWADRIQYEMLNVRKAPHMYGWDIMPRLVSAGLWRGVHLDVVNPTRWRSIYFATLEANVADRTAKLMIKWDFAADRFDIDAWQVRLTIAGNGGEIHRAEYPVLTSHGRQVIDLKNVDLWWPRGYGRQPLYDATFELLDESGRALDIARYRIGLRTVKLVRSELVTETQPGEFVFIVNGEKIFCKGTNWVPLDALHSRDKGHLHAAIDLVTEANCNMVRVWGGSVYEDHDFFDLCDEQGIMVWQDFVMACGVYPQSDAFAERIRVEAESIVKKLRHHPSLVIWSGNNEVDEAYRWSFSGVDPNTDRLTREVLPRVLRSFDPHRPYLPSSPYCSPDFMKLGNHRELQPERHLWGPRDDFKGPFYTSALAHFVSEIGYHGCPDRRSLEEMMDPDHLWPWQDNDQWLTHCTRPHPNFHDWNYRIKLMGKQIGVLFDSVPEEMDDYILASQISQAEAKKFFIEWFRSDKWRRTGILWWNVRDGWPIISDAVVDYYGRRKLAYEYIKRVQRDVQAICREPKFGRHELVVVNDTLSAHSGSLTLRDADTNAVLFESVYEVAPNTKTSLGYLDQSPKPALWLIEWTAGPDKYLNHYLAGPRPFTLDQYKRWLKALRIPGNIGSVAVGAGKMR